jgi:hypothetical protein
MSWIYQKTKARPDKLSLFVVNFVDGSRAFLRVAPDIARFGASPALMRVAHERQAQGELPPGEIDRLVRVR